MEKILITGIAGGLGRLITERLRGSARLVGIDHTPWVGHPPEISIITADLPAAAASSGAGRGAQRQLLQAYP